MLFVSIFTALIAVTLIAPKPSFAGVNAGATCSPVGSKVIVAGKLFTCTKSGNKAKWNSGTYCPTVSSTTQASNAIYICTRTGSKNLWTIARVPSAPTSVVAQIGDGGTYVTFSPGASNSLPIRNYEYSSNNGQTWTPLRQGLVTGPFTLPEITSGAAFKLRAVSLIGKGTASLASSVKSKKFISRTTIRLTSPTINTSNSGDNSGDMSDYINDPNKRWFANGTTYYDHAKLVGDTLTLTYRVIDQDGSPIPFRTIYLRVNRENSSSNASFSTTMGTTNGNANVTGMANGASRNGLVIVSKTNGTGYVTFTVTNTDSANSASNLPSNVTSVAQLRSGNRIVGQIAPMFVPDDKTIDTFSETSQIYDLINFDFFKQGPIVNPDSPPTAVGHTVGDLLWSDEFTGNVNASANSNVWTGRNCGQSSSNGGGTCHNNEQQYYAPSAAKKDGSGNLVITTTKISSLAQLPNDAGTCLSDSRNCSFVSARLDTQGKVSFQYGYIEARISNPTGGANWPAFWMLGDNITSVDWPSSGELDIMEGLGSTPTRTTGAIHYNADASGCCGGHRYDASSSDDGAGFSGSYHRYGIAWLPNSVDLYVDGYRFLHATPQTINSQYWPFNNPFFLILNNAIGADGGFGGTYDGWSSSSMKIDWVRAYQLDSQGTVTTHR